MPDDTDISKKTVLVLLILTLLVSIVGTWTILSQPNNSYSTIEAPTSAKVSINIEEPAKPSVSGMSGKVAVNIVDGGI